MLSLFVKEVKSFFNSLTGYMVLLVFFVMNGLFLWFFPGPFNLPDSGYASLENLFLLAPWMFLFLIPAITMRMFADEKKAGTIELLLTKPVSDFQIILAKYLAGLLLVILAILPTLVYFYTIYQYGNPTGNLDLGGTMGSYIGLVFLAGAYLAIGLFASSLTENQIIGFLIALLMCYLFFQGFDQLAALASFGKIDLLIMNLGINEHYIAMSRGVLDTRDMLYFLSLILVFLWATRLKLQSRSW